MSKKEIKNSPKIISEGLLAIFIPVYGYFIAWMHEIGFCYKFDIPSSLIEISIIDLLKTIAIIITLILALHILIELINITTLLDSYIGRKIILLFFFSLFWLFVIIPFGFFSIFSILWAISILLFLFDELIIPLIQAKDIKGYNKKLQYKYEHDWKHKLLYVKYLKNLNFRATLTLIFILLLIPFAPISGAFLAKTDEQYLIIKLKPELIVLRKYSDKLICTNFDRKKKEIDNKFYIKSINQIADEGIQIVNERVGPLKIHKK